MKRLFWLSLLSLAMLPGCNSSSSSSTPPAISVTPAPATAQKLDQGQTLTVSATVANDSANAGVKWTVSCAAASCGTVAPPTTASAAPAIYTAPSPVTASVAVTVTATSATDSTKSGVVNVTVDTQPSITTTPGQLPGALTGASYSFQLVAGGGTAPFTWSIKSGNLPGGLTLSGGGLISGTPSVAAHSGEPAGTEHSAGAPPILRVAQTTTFSFTVQACDSSATPVCQTSSQFSITENPNLVISPTTLPAGTQYSAYSATFTASGATAPYFWAATGLPAGLSINSTTGTISGTPTGTSSGTVTITVIDSETTPVQTSITPTLTINAPPPLAISPQTLPSGTEGFAYSQVLTGSGGVPPYTWSATGLPAGLSIGSSSSTTATISGTPTGTSSGTVTVTLTDSTATHTSITPTLTINVPQPIVVTITNPVTTVNAGGSAITFNATAVNDPNNAGVTWTLTVSSTNCQPTCGTLSNATSTSVTYTPPATVPASPNNQPTLTATSITDNTKSNTDAFTIQTAPSASCAGTPTGNEALLSGEYAFVVQGWQGSGSGTPVAIVASFDADGTGKIGDLGSGVGGDLDINGTNGHQHVTINATDDNAASLYTVGLDPTSAGNLGCVVMTTSGGTTMAFRFSLQVVSGNTTSPRGHIIEFDDSTGTGTRASGILRLQTKSSFSLSALQSNYAFGIDGVDFGGGHIALAGSFTVNTSGDVTNIYADLDDAGNVSGPTTGGTATIGAISTTTGRSSFAEGSGQNFAAYMVSASEFFMMEIDTYSADFPIWSGKALATASSFSSSSLTTGNYIFHQTGGNGMAGVNIGLLTIGSGAISGTSYEYSNGTAQTSTLGPGTYTVASASGRTTLTGTGTDSPIVYLVSPPVDGIAAFLVGTDNGASFGVTEAPVATTQTFTTASLAGNYFGGTEDPGDNTVTDKVQVLAITSAGALTGTNDKSGSSGLSTGAAAATTLAITNSNGTGNGGTGSILLFNGTKFFFIDESGGSGVIQVFELQ